MRPGPNDALSGKVALVTGASRGVGARIAELLGERHATVAVNYRNKQRRADEVAEAVRAAGGEALPVRADITLAPDLDAMFGDDS